MSFKEQFVNHIHTLQNQICEGLEQIETKEKFVEDKWERPEGGGGLTRVMANGDVFEKGGVNTSVVHGKLPQMMRQKFGTNNENFFACGISLVIHPKNPFVPTTHANWRYFEMYNEDGSVADYWFGGGLDLTPYYLFEEDAKHWHMVCKKSCDSHHDSFYPKYKEECDKYFWNTHRGEARGIGGLFYDYLKADDNFSAQQYYDFTTNVGNHFLEAYVPIVEKRKDLEYSQIHRDWQEIRRGRYVEFNLIHDRGTLFGLKTGGRIESILMSLPSHVQWRYNHQPETGTEEAKLLEVLENPKDWVG